MLETADKRRLASHDTQVAKEAPPTGDKLRQLASLEQPSFDDLIELMLGWAQDAFGTDEIINAREQFFQDMGKAFPDDGFYDARMSYFFDCFLFERHLSQGRGTPYSQLHQQLEARGLTLPEKAAAKLHGLANHRHSLFQIIKLQETSMVVQDLLTPTKLTVKAKGNEIYCGFEKKTILQGFLFQFGDTCHLSQGLVSHPARIASLIKKQVKTQLKAKTLDPRATLCRLASLQMRHMRHRHVDPKLIYQPPT